MIWKSFNPIVYRIFPIIMNTTLKTQKSIAHEDLLELLFATRNRAYGAYVLRRAYPKSVRTALIITLSLAGLLALLRFVEPEKALPKGRIVFSPEGEEIDFIVKPEPPAPPMLETPPPQMREVRFTTPILEENVPDESQEKPPISDTLQTAKNIGDKNIAGPDENRPLEDTLGSWRAKGRVQPSPAPPTVDSIYTSANVQQQAEFPGGVGAMYKWINENIRYPEICLQQGVTGKVYAKFVVERNGRVSQVKIVRSPADCFHKEVKRVLESMPPWNPAKQNGNAVRVYFTLPVDFQTK